MTMEKRDEKRGQGGRGPEGEPKRYILVKIYSFEGPEGITEPDLRDYLARDSYGPKIREPKNIREHLEYLGNKGFIEKISPDPGLPNRWKPTDKIDKFRELWFDNDGKNGKIFMRKDTPLLRKLLKTHHVKQIIRDNIVPALIDFSHSQETRPQLEEICNWACSNSPSLITHAFELKNQDFEGVRFKNGMPNEELCLTIFICLSIDLVKNPEDRDEILDESDEREFKKFIPRLFQIVNNYSQPNDEIIKKIIQIMVLKQFIDCIPYKEDIRDDEEGKKREEKRKKRVNQLFELLQNSV